MSASSEFDINVSIMAWMMNANIASIILELRLYVLPFIAMIVNNTVEPMSSQDAKAGYTVSLRRMWLESMWKLIAITMCLVPFSPLSYSGIGVRSACNNTTTSGASNLYSPSFVEHVNSHAEVKIPLWWAIWQRVSGAFADATVAGVDCQVDFRQVRFEIATTRITDKNLRKDLNDFYQHCYAPALTIAERQDDDFFGLPLPYPKNDWIGAQNFVEINGYYDSLLAPKRVKGFANDPSNDPLNDPNVFTPTYAKPTCKDWWTNPLSGLKKQVLDVIPQEVKDKHDTALRRLWTFQSPLDTSNDAVERDIIRSVLHTNDSYIDENAFNPYTKNHSKLKDAGIAIGAKYGTLKEMINFYPKMYIIRIAAPMVQSYVYNGVVIILPLILLFGGFRFAVIAIVSITLFAVRFWTALWAYIHFLDVKFLESRSPYVLNTYQPFSVTDDVMGFVTGIAFMIMPLLFMGSLAWVGARSSLGDFGSGVLAIANNASSHSLKRVDRKIQTGR